MTMRLFRTVLSVMLSFWAATAALAQVPATQTCQPAPDELVRLAKPMGVGTWSGNYCGYTILGPDGLIHPEDRGHLLLLTDDGQLLRLQASECAHDPSLAQSPEAQALQDATLHIRLTLTVGKSRTDPKSNELMEAKDSTGKVVYRLGQCN